MKRYPHWVLVGLVISSALVAAVVLTSTRPQFQPQYTWTYSGTLFGPLPPNTDNICHNMDWTDAPKITFAQQDVPVSDITMNADGSVSLTATKGLKLAPGCYLYGPATVTRTDTTTGQATVFAVN